MGTVLGHSKGWVFTSPTKPWGPREGFETEGPGLKLFVVVWLSVGKRGSSQEAPAMVACKVVRRAGELGGRQEQDLFLSSGSGLLSTHRGAGLGCLDPWFSHVE